MIFENDFCWCGSKRKWKNCHQPHVSKEDFDKYIKNFYLNNYRIIIKSKEQIAKIKKACDLAAYILDELCKKAKKGVTTNELDALSMQLHKENKAIPAPLGYGYPPYPKSICTSINEVICHGIPNDRPLQDGDILNIDVTSILDGYYGDCSKMITIGHISEEKEKVIDVTYQCMMDAISICKPGVKILEIGNVIEKIAKENNFSVVDQFVGHGIGEYFHEAPHIQFSYNNCEIEMVEGMTFTIEPMINVGVKEAVMDNDRWTARTKDGKPSAQFEHTILITKNGNEILTTVK